jgi:hypothetical protein
MRPTFQFLRSPPQQIILLIDDITFCFDLLLHIVNSDINDFQNSTYLSLTNDVPSIVSQVSILALGARYRWQGTPQSKCIQIFS